MYDKTYYRDFAVHVKMAGNNERTILFTHASMSGNILSATDKDYVTIELLVTQKEDKYYAVTFGETVEETYATAKKRLEEPPRLNIVVPPVMLVTAPQNPVIQAGLPIEQYEFQLWEDGKLTDRFPVSKYGLEKMKKGILDLGYKLERTYTDGGTKEGIFASTKPSITEIYVFKREIIKEEVPPAKVTSLDAMGYNMIANMERNLKQIEHKDGKITNIPKDGHDIGYGHDIVKNPVNNLPDDLSASEAFELLQKDTIPYEVAIATGINANFTQNQFNALVSLRYNIGSLGVVDGLLPYLEDGAYERNTLKNLINQYYDLIIKNNSNLEIYRDGWYNRTNRFIDIFFDGDYGYMPIDAVNGVVK